MDATAPLRNKIVDAVKSVIPESTPLGKSIKDAEAKEKEDALKAAVAAQAPIDEKTQASREVAATPPQNFVKPVSAPATPIANAVAQGPAPAFDFNAELPSDLKGGLQEQRQAYQQEADIYKQQAAEIAKTEAQFAQESEREAQLQKQAEDLQAQINKDVDERSRMRVEPKNFFAGKNTWQKVLGGLGLFLSSFSKEGAARFAEAVNNDIEMDIRAQESAINSKDKAIAEKNTLYKQYLDQYKDARAARLLTRADAYNMIKLKAEAALGMTKSKAAAGAARQAIGLAEQESQKNKLAAAALIMKNRAAMSEGQIPGYTGMIADKAEARKFKESLAQRDMAMSAIDELEKIVDVPGKSFNPTIRSRAEQLTQDLQLQLKEIKALGVLSGDDSKRLDAYIENPASFFKLDSTSRAQLAGLKSIINNALRAREAALNIKPNEIGRKVK